MSKQTINIGASPNDGTGTPLRTSFDYTNQNFTEIYTALGGGVALPGATTQVIFNDGGTNLAGDAGLVYNKTTDALTVAGLVTAGSATITGDLTARNWFVTGGSLPGVGNGNPFAYRIGGGGLGIGAATETGTTAPIVFYAGQGGVEQYRIAPLGVNTWSDGAGGTRMTLNSTGLGVGTTNYIGKIQAAGLVAAADPTFGTSGTFIGAILNNDNTAPGLDLRRWTGAAANHGTTYISTDATGATFFYNGTQVSNTKATSLKMTLDASGNLLVGTASGTLFRIISSFLSSSGNGGIKLIDSLSNNTAVFANFSNGTGTLGSITNNNNAGVLYNVTSDKRLKENISDSESASLLIDSLQVRKFDWKANNSHQRYGFIAQELVTVVPEAVYQPTNSDDMMAVDYSKLVPMLVKEIQSLRTRVQTLEAR